MRTSWSGNVSATLFSFGVGMASLVSDGKDDKAGPHQYAPDGSRIKIRRVSEKDPETEVPYSEIRKGWMTEHGLVTMSDDDYSEALGGIDRDARVKMFCDPSEVPLVAMRRPLIMQPAKKKGTGRKMVRDESAIRSYALLRDLLERTGKVAIVEWGVRESKHLAMIRPYTTARGKYLMLVPFEYAQYLAEADFDAPEAEFTETELALGGAIIDAMTDEFVHADYRDDARERVDALVAAKAELLRKANAGEVAAASEATQVADEVEDAPAQNLEDVLSAVLRQLGKDRQKVSA
jgi:DNA end-binding protein Ku